MGAIISTNTTAPTPETSEDPMALAKTLGFAFAVVAVSVGVFLAARFHTGLHEVYAPRSARGEWGAAAFPGFFLGAWREARATLRAVEALAVGLEAACCQRFVRLQLRLLVAATLIAFCLMPIYAVQPAAIDPDGVLAADAATNTTWSALEVITLNHVPRRNDRVVCAGIAALVYALVYVAALGREWRRYHELKQRWSGRDGIQHATVLLTAEGDAPVDAAEVNAWLGALYLPCTFPVPSLYLPCTFPVPSRRGERVAGCLLGRALRRAWTGAERRAAPQAARRRQQRRRRRASGHGCERRRERRRRRRHFRRQR
jgi:hypothetical protein